MRSLYDILGVDERADERVLKRAFRRMARAHHPDLNPDDAHATERFIELAVAFEVLSDPPRRALYDEFGAESLSERFDPVRARWARGEQERSRPGAASSATWRAEAQEPWSARFKREYDRDRSSFKSVFDKAFRDFNPFASSGLRDEERFKREVFIEPGEDVRAEIALTLLESLLGGPRTLDHHDGSTLTVNLPAGVCEGEVLVIAGEGKRSEHGRGEPGDLLLTVRVSEQGEQLKREGRDLTLELPVTVPEALLGAKIEVPTPHGACTMTLPAGVSSGATLRLRSMGLERDGERGDLFVRVKIISPAHLSQSQREAAATLAKAYSGSVRAHLKG